MGPPSMVHEQYTGLPRWILTIHQVSVKDRRTFFHAVVTSVACFAAGHRKIFKQELAAFDVAHRKVLRRVVGPAARMDWSRPWHEILHDWKVRVSIFVGQAGLRPWPHTCLAISEICSACGKFTVWEIVTSAVALETCWTTSCWSPTPRPDFRPEQLEVCVQAIRDHSTASIQYFHRHFIICLQEPSGLSLCRFRHVQFRIFLAQRFSKSIKQLYGVVPARCKD